MPNDRTPSLPRSKGQTNQCSRDCEVRDRSRGRSRVHCDGLRNGSRRRSRSVPRNKQLRSRSVSRDKRRRSRSVFRNKRQRSRSVFRNKRQRSRSVSGDRRSRNVCRAGRRRSRSDIRSRTRDGSRPRSRSTSSRRQRRSRSGSRGRSRRYSRRRSRIRSPNRSRASAGRSLSERVRGENRSLRKTFDAIFERLNVVESASGAGISVPTVSHTDRQNNLTSQNCRAPSVSDIPIRDDLRSTNADPNAKSQTQQNYLNSTREVLNEKSNISETAKTLAEVIKSLQPVRSQNYYVSNFDPAINNIEQWCEEVDRARNANGWNDHECLSRVASCLKGDARVWLSEWVTSDRTWSNFKLEFIPLCPRKLDYANILYEAMKYTSDRYTTYAEYARRTLLRLRIVKGLSSDLMTLIVIRGIDNPQVRAAAANADLNPETLVSFLSIYAKSGRGKPEPSRDPRQAIKKRPVQVTFNRNESKCFSCGQRGHISRNCTKSNPRETVSNPSKVIPPTCAFCKKPGHVEDTCFAKNRSEPRNQRKVNLCNDRSSETYKNNDVSTAVVEGVPMDVLIDSGALNVSLISSDVLKHLSCQPKPRHCVLKGISDQEIVASSYVTATVEISNISIEADLVVVPSTCMNTSIVIGTDVLNRDGVTYVRTKDRQYLTHSPHTTVEINSVQASSDVKTPLQGEELKTLMSVVNEFSDYLISGTATTTVKTGERDIKLTSPTPVVYRPYKLSYEEKLKVREITRDLLDKGFIRESQSEYASPIILVKKKDGKDRMCVDYRALNRLTVKDRYPLPLIDDHIDRLGNYKYFTSLDMATGFHQIPISERSIPLTGFVTPEGHFEYLKMPYGLTNSPIVYQRIINNTLRRFIDAGQVLVYVDDVLIMSSTVCEGINLLRDVLKTLTEAGFSINLRKCSFLETEVEYLGRIVSQGQVRPSPSKVEALVNAPIPTNVRQVRQFLGLAGYFRRYIKGNSTKTACIAHLTKKGVPFNWGSDKEKVRQELIHHLTSEPVLAIFDPALPTEVHTDASSGGYGETTQAAAQYMVSWRGEWCPESCAAFFEYCLHLQLYRDSKDRFKKGQTKASLSLQQFLGFESGFTLDKESNTIAIICQDVVVVLAFETRERLIAWQVKVGSQLGSSREFLVLVGGGGARKLPAGPARLHLQGRRFALTSGVPPRLLGLWELAHLRRFGVVEGRFCFEGGSLCGKGEGLHVFITDQAQEITDAFDLAATGNLTGQRSTPSRKSAGDKGNITRPSTRLSDLNTVDQSLPDTSSGLYEENFFGEDCGRISPYWLSDERRGSEDPDFRRSDINIGTKPPWGAADHVTLERCTNCLTELGVSRSSTVALSPTSHFNPAWTMEAVPESSSDSSSNNTEYLTPRMIRKTLEACHCKEKPPQRPPKPGHLESKKQPAPLPSYFGGVNDNKYPTKNSKVGPYENYDIPKPAQPVVEISEYYDTPKRIKQAITEDLFQVTKASTPGALVLKKNCGCILKFATQKKPVIVECEETVQPVECPCQKVTNWANNLISLPYCKREPSDRVKTEVLTCEKSEEMAIYATVDMSRKTNRQSGVSEKDNQEITCESAFTNYQNVEPSNEHEGPYANYENLEFALSLEYYENAKDLLKKAGVTQKELDALSANVELASSVLPKKPGICKKCGHNQHKIQDIVRKNKSDEYLLMEPPKDAKRDVCQTVVTNPGYTPMSPNPNWSQSLKHPLHKLHKVDIEKYLSIPALNGDNRTEVFADSSSNNNKEAIQKRSCSIDSARLLEDLKEFDSSIGSHATSSSLETLRNLAIDNRRTSSPCDDERECYECCKSSGSENKTSEESSSKDVPHLRNKLMDNAQIKRSSSVPCKSGGNRDSSSSNDSGVSSCSMKHGGEFQEFEMPLTSGHSRYHYMIHKRMRGNLSGCIHSSLPRKSKSSDLLREQSMKLYKGAVSAKSSSAEAEVPVLPPKQFKGVLDTHSTSSGTSDMSDYIETLSLTSSHSSSDTPSTMRINRQPTNTLRPRSGKEYHNLDPIITSMYKTGKDLANYTNLP